VNERLLELSGVCQLVIAFEFAVWGNRGRAASDGLQGAERTAQKGEN